MSATNSRIAKLNRALKQLEDYEQHKADWSPAEASALDLAVKQLMRLKAQEQSRLAA